MVEVKAAPDARDDDLYERDHHLWLTSQIERLRERQFERLDLARLIEELEDVAGRQKRAIRSNLVVLLAHLLKHAFQPEQRSSSWTGSIVEHRRRILEEFEDSPSLRHYPAEVLAHCYDHAREQAAAETGLPEARLPENCPWAVQQVLQRGFLPD